MCNILHMFTTNVIIPDVCRKYFCSTYDKGCYKCRLCPLSNFSQILENQLGNTKILITYSLAAIPYKQKGQMTDGLGPLRRGIKL